MNLGRNILKLRKQHGLSQEQLGEMVNVTRQTISNWELNETAPNPEQLKLLSKALNVSIDVLLDNEPKEVSISKVSNTEKLAGMIIKILKIMGLLFIIFVVIDITALILFTITRKKEPEITHDETLILTCTLNSNEYVIGVGNDGNFSCSACSNDLQKELEDSCIADGDIDTTKENIIKYFEKNNGSCE